MTDWILQMKKKIIAQIWINTFKINKNRWHKLAIDMGKILKLSNER